MSPLFDQSSEITDSLLRVIAHMPTRSLPILMNEAFSVRLGDFERMRIAVFLAQQSYDQGGCPIGAVIVDNQSGRIVGKGHNTLVQESHPYNHGETAAIRDAGRIDFSQTTLYTSLSPCDICAQLLSMRGFARVVIGDVTNASGSEALLRDKGVAVDVLEDPVGVALYAQFRTEQPALELEDWRGLAAVNASFL